MTIQTTTGAFQTAINVINTPLYTKLVVVQWQEKKNPMQKK